MKYHKTVEKIKDLLVKNDVWFETFEHRPVLTSREAAEIRTGYSLSEGAKSIIIRVKSGGERFFVMLVFPGDRKFSASKVKQKLGSKDIRFATEDEVKKITGGVLPGGVPPFGNLFGLKVVSDPALFAIEKIIFNAGDRRFSLAMKSRDYRKLVEPEIADIIE